MRFSSRKNMKNFIKKYGLSISLTLLSIITMIGCWAVASLIAKNDYVIPNVIDTFKDMGALFKDGNFYNGLFNTLLRTLYSVVIAYLLGGALAIVTIIFKPLKAFFVPIVSVIRVVPTMAVLLIILLFTTPSVSPIVVSLLVLVPMVYQQFLTAFAEIDDGVISVLKVFGVSKSDRVFKVYLPLILPSTISNLGTNFSFSIKLIVSAEVLAYTFNGLGGLMRDASVYFAIPRLASLTLFAVIIGILIEVVFNLLSKLLFKWNTTGVKYD